MFRPQFISDFSALLWQRQGRAQRGGWNNNPAMSSFVARLTSRRPKKPNKAFMLRNIDRVTDPDTLWQKQGEFRPARLRPRRRVRWPRPACAARARTATPSSCGARAGWEFRGRARPHPPRTGGTGRGGVLRLTRRAGELGEGSFGMVHKVKHKTTGQLAAAKVVPVK